MKTFTFRETVAELSVHHSRLWFTSKQDIDEMMCCDRWTGGEILTGSGRMLAMQAGHPDEWKLNFNHTKPDPLYEPDECEEGVLITPLFLSNVKIFMNLFVMNNINSQGDYIRDHTPDSDTIWKIAKD